ncbi:MAG: protein kinase [Bryobacteraceae bacterium]|nr:protein kinase [Bryobacteraceae bacterium]
MRPDIGADGRNIFPEFQEPVTHLFAQVPYMSPEQAEGKPLDGRSDIFSFGAVLYEMLSGAQAFQGRSKAEILAAILHEEPTPLEEVAPDLPYHLYRLVAQCLRKQSERRWQHMEDVKALLEQLLEEAGSVKWATRAPARQSRIPAFRAWMALGLIPLAGLAWYLASPFNRQAPLNATFTKLTDQPGQELYPSLSPDGKSFVYQSRLSGNWDIRFQRAGGTNPLNLTQDSREDDVQPAFSPDGERIAFRSERGGGGIFVMGATGENVKRITEGGYNPAWSPDGKEIVFATAGFGRADVRMGLGSQLYVVNVETQERRLVTAKLDDCVQPHWSPHGDRIACWGYIKANRDIWSVPAAGGEPVPVTSDLAFDWSPVWSPDGRYSYFSSDRGGSMNLWRVRVEERSGRPMAAPELFTTPSLYSSQLSFSQDGRRMAYVQSTIDSNLNRAGFDGSRSAAVGQPTPVTRDSIRKTQVNASPDGRWLAFASVGTQDDLFVIRTDGTGLRQLTDDAARDRMPAWSPDGKRLAFYSDRSGTHQVWIMNADGSGLRQLTNYRNQNVMTPLWSPDGARIACTVQNGVPLLIDPDRDWKDQSPQPLTPLAEKGAWLWLWSWSGDGRKLGATLMRPDSGSAGFGIYSLDSKQFRLLRPSGGWPVWLRDNRRLLYMAEGSSASYPSTGKLYVIDSVSGTTHQALWIDPFQFENNFGLPAREGPVFRGLTNRGRCLDRYLIGAAPDEGAS